MQNAPEGALCIKDCVDERTKVFHTPNASKDQRSIRIGYPSTTCGIHPKGIKEVPASAVMI